MPPRAMWVSIAILAGLPISAGLVAALVLAADFPLFAGLLLLAVLDVAILVGGYIAIRRSFSDAPEG
jgi:hypothetical protein